MKPKQQHVRALKPSAPMRGVARPRAGAGSAEARPPAEPALVGLILSLKDPSVVYFHPWNSIGVQVLNVLRDAITDSPVGAGVNWFGCLVTLDDSAKLHEFVSDGGLGMLTRELLRATSHGQLAGSDGCFAHLYKFPDRDTAEVWLRKRAAPSTESVKSGGMGEGSENEKRAADAELRSLGRISYTMLRERLAESFDRDRVRIAAQLEQPLNVEINARPHASYDEKKELAKWVNGELRSFGLAIKCPKTARPAILLGSPTGTPGVGRFHLEVMTDEGIPKRTVTSVEVPRLGLMLADLSWAKSGGRGR